MNKYLNIQANKKNLVTKIIPKNNFPIRKFSNRVKGISINIRKCIQLNNNKENLNRSNLTEIGNLSLQQEMSSINNEKTHKLIVYRKKSKGIINKPKEFNKVKFIRNSYNIYENNLKKEKIPSNKKPKKIITSIPLNKNYVRKTFSTRNYKKKNKISLDSKIFPNHEVNKSNICYNGVHTKKNSIITNLNSTDCNFIKKGKIKSADISPIRKQPIKLIIKNNKRIIEEKVHIKNNSMIVGQNKKRKRIIKFSKNIIENKNKEKDKSNNNIIQSFDSAKTKSIPFKKIIINKNPQMVEEYFDDIYKYLKTIENSDLPKENYMNIVQNDITEKMRKILLDWLIDVHYKFNLLSETLFLTINIIDRYLSKKSINRKYFQLLGVTSMFISSKYEDIYPPEIKDFIFMTDNAYTREELMSMENDILDKIQFNMTYPTSFRFLEIFKKIINLKDIDFYRCRYFIEIALFDYNCCHFPPSLIAATSIFLNYKLNINKNGDLKNLENKILTSIQYDLKEIKPCLNCLINAIKKMTDIGNKYNSIKRKFEKEEFMKVSKEKIDINKIF